MIQREAALHIIVGIGSNLPDAAGHTPWLNCRAAVTALRGLAGCRLVAISGWYQSAAWPPSAEPIYGKSTQPDYINGAVLLSGAISPAALLAALHRIEALAGRRRSVPNAARPLDLDIIAMGELVRDAPDPILPHPRAHQRGFVLRPIGDLLPAWRHPTLGKTVGDLLAALPDADEWVARPAMHR